jgi:asparagine synthase (glutamine-hydrolysing)
MCGIAGAVSWTEKVDRAAIISMTRLLAHRGPDASDVAALGPAVFGHRRLSIIDTSSAADQPMFDEASRSMLVFNGEIYNFREIRAELESAGVKFRTRSDSEVILAAFRRWDVECLDRFNGMFAFALWDEDRGRLFLARDRAGEKPLFFSLVGGGIVFASELNAMLVHPQMRRQVSHRAVGQFLSLNYVLTSACLLEGVQKLPPAHYLLLDRTNQLCIRRYWDLASSFREKRDVGSERLVAEELAGLIEDSVRLRLVSDVPLGAFLSGGIDSATVVAAMSHILPPSLVKTFTIGFHEEGYSEAREAETTAGCLRVDHSARMVDGTLAAALPMLVEACDEPMADSSAIPFYYLAGFAREKVTVCLSGDGGDEIMAGYPTYLADRLRDKGARLPGAVIALTRAAVDRFWPVTFDKGDFNYRLRHFLRGISAEPRRAHVGWRTIFYPDEIRRVVRPEFHATIGLDAFEEIEPFFAEVEGCDIVDQGMYVDIKTWLVDDILVKVDRTTMAHSLESRAPFLDHRLMEFAASLPVDYKLRGNRQKYILKESQKPRLPAAILGRRKQGFNSPVSHWLVGPLCEMCDSILADPVLTDWLDPVALRALRDEHMSRRSNNGLKLFGLMWLALWMKKWNLAVT